nr:integrase, catalytic region, zinc finger, CCHC-type, peptidase aspartic, catalytic [Tanacetum cinerariifolium]
MQGTSLTKQEKKCKPYDEFNKFSYKKGKTLREFYLRFSLLLNDMNIYNMKLEQFQVNTKFLNTLPPEWSKFVTDKGDDPSDAINHMMSFLTVVVTSRYPPTNNQLRNSSNPRQQATINNGRVTVQPIQGRHTSLVAGTSRTYTSGASGNNFEKQRTIICYNCKGKEAQTTQNVITHNVAYQADHLDAYESDCDESTLPKLYSWRIYLTMVQMILLRTTQVEVPKELPKVSMVNTSLKKLKHHLANIDVVVKERTTATAITEGVNLSTSASGSQPSGNTKKDKIQQTPSSSKKNKIEAHPRNVRSSLSNKNCVVKTKNTASGQNSKSNVNSDLQCVTCNGCLFANNHDSYVLEIINNVNARVKSKSVKRKIWKPIGKVIQIVLCYLDSGCSKHVTGDRSHLTNFVDKFLGMVKFGNDHVAKIMGYGDYQIRNVTISRVYFVDGLGHNLFSVGQLCDSDREVAFRQHTCFIRNLEDNGTEFVNQTLREYYEQIGISHETSVACSPQQNSVVERRNRMLIEAARTMLIYARALLFLWAEGVGTACFTQNRSIIRLHHGKTPYELLHDKLPDLSYFHVFGALCYPTNDSENLGSYNRMLT